MLPPRGDRPSWFRPHVEAMEERLMLSVAPLESGSALSASSAWLGSFSDPTAQYDALTGLRTAQENYHLDGAGQTVVVVDSGVAYDHEAFGGYGLGHQIIGGYDFAEGDDDPYDDGPFGSHGTHVAGILVGQGQQHRGVAPGADLVSLRVFDDMGTGDPADLERALQWVLDHRNDFANPITTVNLSIGLFTDQAAALIDDELAALYAEGIFITAAAGNGFASGTSGLAYPASSEYVAAATSFDASGALSYFAQRDASVIAAPGRSVTSAIPDYLGNRDGVVDDYAAMSGTSMAAPYLAGASMLLRQAFLQAGYQNVDTQTLYRTLYDTADTVFDAATQSHYRRLNVLRAVESVAPADDFASTAADAFALGTIQDARQLQGKIEAAADLDYFRFAVADSGTITIQLERDDALTATLRDISTSDWTQSGDTWTLQLSEGQTCVFAVAGVFGTGDYEIQLTFQPDASAPEPSMPEAVDVEQETFRQQQVDSDGTWLAARATADGILTVEGLVRSTDASAGLAIEVVDDQGNVLGTAQRSGDAIRADIDVAADQVVYIRAVSRRAIAVDFRVTNLVSIAGGTLTLRGTQRNDQVEINIGQSSHRVVVGQTSYVLAATEIDRAQILLGEGHDELTIRGTGDRESIEMQSSQVTLYSRWLAILASGAENVHFDGRGGLDHAILHGSSGQDALHADATRVQLITPEHRFSTANTLRVAVHGHGGNDRAEMAGSAGADVLRSTPRATQFDTAAWNLSVTDFERVSATAGQGGAERAILRDSAGNDRLVATPIQTELVTSSGSLAARGFDNVVAYSTAGGHDTAVFRGSDGTDRLAANSRYVVLRGMSYMFTAHGFDDVSADGGGGYDVAMLCGTGGSDRFTLSATQATLQTPGQRYSITAFDRVHAEGGGGYDLAMIAAEGDQARFEGVGSVGRLVDAAHELSFGGFETVWAYAPTSGDHQAEYESIDYALQLMGDWNA